jgi:outer membrane protein assembly factor BamB
MIFTRTALLAFLSCIVLSASVQGAQPTAEWPGWRGANRDGISPDKGLLREWPKDGPALVWKTKGLGKGFSSASVSGGLVYTAGYVDRRMKVFAFSTAGKPVWQVDLDEGKDDPDGSRSTPVIDGGLLYIISGKGLVGCFDAKKGEKKWTRTMKEFGGNTPGWGYSESVLIWKKLAIVTPGGKNCLVALDKKTGKTVWQSQGYDGGAQYGSSIAIDFQGKPIIIAGTHKGIVGVSATDGKVLWSNEWSAGNTANCPTPAYADGHVFWSNGYGKGGICLKLEAAGGGVTAKEAWTTQEMICHHGGYVIVDGVIYGNHENGWSALELKTGKKLWSTTDDGGDRTVKKGSLCFADGMLYLFGESDGKVGLAEASPKGFALKGRFQVAGSGPSWAHPVVVGGRLYLRYDENLYCFDVKRG